MKILTKEFFLFCVLFVIYFLTTQIELIDISFFLFFCLLINLEVLYRVRKQKYLLILSLFAATYPLYIFIAKALGVRYHLYEAYQTEYLTSKVFLIQTVSLKLMLFKLERCSSFYNGIESHFVFRKNSLVFVSLLLSLFFMALASVIGNDFSALNGSYSIESSSSIFFEYCIPFLICAFLYSKNNVEKRILLIFFVVFMVLPLLMGRRLPFLMVSLLFFYFYYIDRVSTRGVFLLVLLGFAILSVIASFRIGGDVEVLDSFFAISKDGVMENNQGGVIISAATYLGLIDDGYFDFGFRLRSLIGMFLSPFTTSDLALPETFVNFSAMKYANIPGNGGLPGVYFYIWGGWLGVILGSLIINKVLSGYGKGRYRTAIALFFLVTFPRWYAYNMIILFKMLFWFIVLLVLVDLINSKFSKLKWV